MENTMTVEFITGRLAKKRFFQNNCGNISNIHKMDFITQSKTKIPGLLVETIDGKKYEMTCCTENDLKHILKYLT